MKKEEDNRMINTDPAEYGKDIAEFSFSDRVLKYSRLSSKLVSCQGIVGTEQNKNFELLLISYVARSLNFWNVYVRVPWNTVVQLAIQYLQSSLQLGFGL